MCVLANSLPPGIVIVFENCVNSLLVRNSPDIPLLLVLLSDQ